MPPDQSTITRTEDTIKSLVKKAKKNRENRVYWFHDFNPREPSKVGVIRDCERIKHDQVALDHHQSEAIRYCGFDTIGSYFELDFSISSLYPDVQNPTIESRWRLAQVKLIYLDADKNIRYSYKSKELIDYEEKRQLLSSRPHEVKQIYKIGSLTLEIIIPFALCRILLNGVVQREKLTSEGETNQAIENVPVRMSISCHPCADKFDYKYRFSTKFLTETIQKSTSETTDPNRLLDLALEDRIEHSIMFRGKLDCLGTDSKVRFDLWGLRTRRVIDAQKELASQMSYPIESLTMWTECGYIIKLNRPVGYPSLVYGAIDCNYGFLSPLYGASCLVPNGVIETDFGRLTSFSKLVPGVKMTLRAFRVKQILIELPDGVDTTTTGSTGRPFRVIVNGLEGWGFNHSDAPNEQIKKAQSRLWTFDIHDRDFSYVLRSETLLGGKGNSLVELSNMVSRANDVADLVDPTQRLGCESIEIPKGLILTSVAYQKWLDSNPLIASSIRELDITRRSLAAKSYYLNPLSDKHLNLSQRQQMLKNQCQKTSLVLNSCPLPVALRKQLYSELSAMFGEAELKDRAEEESEQGISSNESQSETFKKQIKFAVRSSALGEDSTETSGAGQMKTILDACGFESICRAIVSCWSSQFELEAVTYKTQNGLLFNWPMAVVIQKLVDCHSAGVSATCNPMTGDRLHLEISANLGLGEGVVSGNKADTIRIDLSNVPWDRENERYSGTLGPDESNAIKIISENEDGNCCLEKSHIISLANTLIWLMGNYKIKQREVEWGITLSKIGEEKEDEISTSSYNSTISSLSQWRASKNQKQLFKIHLLQSRPLTNLSRLDTDEVFHELDNGISSPHEVLSRANLAEVMPGSFSPLSLTAFLHYCRLIKPEYVCRNETCEPYASGSFSHHSRLVFIIMTNNETLSKFRMTVETARSESETMIGFQSNEIFMNSIYEKMIPERKNPILPVKKYPLLDILLYDSGMGKAKGMIVRNKLKSSTLYDKLPTIDELLDSMDHPHTNKQQNSSKSSNEDPKLSSKSLAIRKRSVDEFGILVRKCIEKLYERILDEIEKLSSAWIHHVRCTMTSMAYNKLCVEVISRQPCYKDDGPEKLNDKLNDFNILIRHENHIKTESGNIATLLDQLVESIYREGQLKQAQRMSCKELYDYLNSESNTSESAVRFRKFMRKNGHRGNKEFDFSMPTWSDDPSFVVKSLEARLKIQKSSLANNKRDSKQEELKSKEKQEYEQVLAKIENFRPLLLHYLLPRSRNATIRREDSKSMMIKALDVHRKAYRYLAALLCLEGKLPDVNLINFMTLDELDSVIKLNDEQRVDLARYIYKARRRQQTARLGDNLKFEKPTIDFKYCSKTMDLLLEGDVSSTINSDGSKDNDNKDVIKGMTSCAGRVTGRACVVESLEEMHLVQPNDILITYSIDISWSVYFFTLSGIVTEVGGIVSHGAVIAREYGIPTLCTAIGACSRFKTGQMVTLDAYKGIIYPAEE